MEAATYRERKSQTREGLSCACGLRWGGWRGRGGLLALGKWRGARRSGSLVSLGMTIYGGRDGLGRWRLGGLWGLTPTGLPGRTGAQRTGTIGHYMLSEFSARGRQGSLRRWGGSVGKWRVVSGEWRVAS